MDKAQVLQRIVEIGIVPVIRVASSEDALAAAEAVSQGGIPIVEITMTVPGAIEVIQSLNQRRTDLLIGAGTVLDAATARQCFAAGAQFLASPGLDLETVEVARSQGKVMFAGALSPTEVIAAWKANADFVKVFPSSAVGGPKYIASLKGLFPEAQLVPSGGVSLETAPEFILAGASALAAGGELIEASALRAHKLATIAQKARSFVELVRQARRQLNGPAAS